MSIDVYYQYGTYISRGLRRCSLLTIRAMPEPLYVGRVTIENHAFLYISLFINNRKKMAKLCINSRDELRLIELNEVLFLKASGSYTDFHLVNGQVKSEAQCLSYFEASIKRLYQSSPNPFFRTGRSYYINTSHLSSINIQIGIVTFDTSTSQPLMLSKRLLRKLKEHITATLTDT